MTNASSSLRERLLRAFADDTAPARAAASLKDVALVVCGPGSFLASIHLPSLLARGANVVLAVDDWSRVDEVAGIPVCTSGQLAAELARRVPKGTPVKAVDFTQSRYGQARFRALAQHLDLPMHDLVELLAAYDCPGVYEPVLQYRARTKERADDWLAFAESLEDERSRETLYAVLLQRLEFDRHALDSILTSPHDEYFGVGSAHSETFAIGTREHFVDCGAHTGTVVAKLLGATDWKVESVHAFEPDAKNYEALNKLMPYPLPFMNAHHCAVSDRNETLRFHETGTMGSHVSASGGVEVPCVKLDDRVEDATFIKMDVEGFEARALRGAAQLIARAKPRMAIASYHYANDLLDVADTLREIVPGHRLNLRHHYSFFYDSIIYASPRDDWAPLTRAQ
ncbi:FkbM family methyltransferase [Paraburkholderia unamae]|uniref:FkbM family methyltransferase n=1 Tax=Paraburkholderia unamae TaxID=219649 RepID=A0ABX5KUT7_9BURK|nr:FkbM family methyltransferase [Paraburkholderia unamae]PVX97426.1 FkbM family methyltransferase [Paraburkholderia unamae]CAG9274086.1 FkbM family methyltransferase [Paraburkholderia unamae]